MRRHNSMERGRLTVEDGLGMQQRLFGISRREQFRSKSEAKLMVGWFLLESAAQLVTIWYRHEPVYRQPQSAS